MRRSVALEKKRGVSYVLGSRAESLPVSDVRVAGLDALDLISMHYKANIQRMSGKLIKYICMMLKGET